MSPTPRPRRIARALFAVPLALALFVACSKTEPTAAPGTSGGSAAPGAAPVETTTTIPVPVYPLTGLPVTDPARAALPALVMKIDNVDSTSRPQAGINLADLIYEEKVEGPIGRFAAIYQTNEAPDVGPIRSGRSTDISIVSSLNTPLYVFSGANDVFAKKFREAPLVYISYDNQPYLFERRKGRPAPDDVMTSTTKMREQTPEGAQPPVQQLSYRAAGAQLPEDAVDVTTFGYDFGGGSLAQPVSWTWDRAKGGWLRVQKGTPHVDSDGVQIAPQNVIVQFVPYVDTGLVDHSGTAVPEAQMLGLGDAWVFTDGKAVHASWSKPDQTSTTAFTGADGKPIGLTPGQTWIALVPIGANFAATRADGTPLA